MNLAVSRARYDSLLKITTRFTSASLFAPANQQFNRKMSSQSIEEKFQFPKRYQGSTPSVWYFFNFMCSLKLWTLVCWCFIFSTFLNLFIRNEYITLAMTYQPLNLGQGFADYPVPQYITDALASTANNPNCLLNQYTRGFVSVICC